MNARYLISGEDILATLKLAVPLVIAELGWMLMGIVDTMFVGRLPNSADAIGASGLGNAIYINIVLLLGGVLLALDTIISQAFGAGLLEECRDAMVHGLYIALALTPVITAATFVIIEMSRA